MIAHEGDLQRFHCANVLASHPWGVSYVVGFVEDLVQTIDKIV